MQFLDSINRIEEERKEKEAQVRSQTDEDLRQVQADVEMRMRQLRASASHTEAQIRNGRDEQLKRIATEMNQRRQVIRARLESIIHGQSVDGSTNSGGTPSIEADLQLQHLVSINNRTQSIGAETEISEGDRGSHANLGERNIGPRRSTSFGDWT